MKLRHEIRRRENGSLDEVLLYADAEDGKGEVCVAHLEQMSETHWWLGLQHGAVEHFVPTEGPNAGGAGWLRTESTLHVRFYSRKSINVDVEDDV